MSTEQASPHAQLAAAVLIIDTTNDESDLQKTIVTLNQLQMKISASCTDDISTPDLELLSSLFYIGRAYLKLPTLTDQGPDSNARKTNLLTANVYFDKYLRTCEEISLLNDDLVKEYHLLLDLLDSQEGGDGDNKSQLSAGQIREMKIGRYQRKKTVEGEIKRLEGLKDRRTRLGMDEEEEMEGLDGEGLRRDLGIERLRLYIEESLEEMQSSKSELEMLNMAIQFQAMRKKTDKPDARMSDINGIEQRPRKPQQPLQLTQITQDPISGQLQFNKQQINNGTLQSIGLPTSSLNGQRIQRQQISEGVFKPSWNLPTMSLEELAERERADAIARSELQKESEERAKTMPRRYEQLVKDGMEDDADLVEKSAELDRKWDEWKEENPRGSGNKMSERGDRNF